MSVRTMSAVWAGSRHGGTELLLLLAIADFADDQGRAYPSISTLATKCRTKPRYVLVLLEALSTSGELEIRKGQGPVGRGGRTNLYRVQLDRLVSNASPGELTNQGSPVNRGAVVHGDAGSGEPGCREVVNHGAHKPSGTLRTARLASMSAPNCPYESVLIIYNESLSDEQVPWPPVKASRLTKSRREAIRRVWQMVFTEPRPDGTYRANTEAEGLSWFKRFFTKAWENDHWAGRTPRGSGHERWRCDIEHLLKERQVTRVIEE